MLVYLFGGYARTGTFPDGTPAGMRFLSYRRARDYHLSFWGSIDPYARLLTGPTAKVPGKRARRAHGEKV